MKGRFLYLAAGALALSACTSENVLEDVTKTNNVISFENVVNKNSRVTDLETSSIQKFYVWGFYSLSNDNNVAFPVFENIPVTKQPNGSWTYTGGDRYWVPDARYYFYAYSCGDISKLDTDNYGSFSMVMTEGFTPEKRMLKITDYICDKTHQHDLIFASNTGAVEGNKYAGIEGKTAGNSQVSLKFSHVLSKVKAQFTSAFPAGYTVDIDDVKLYNFHNVGTYNPDINGWESVRHHTEGVAPEVVLLTPEQTITTSGTTDKATTEAAYVIPYVYAAPTDPSDTNWVYINFDITVKNSGKVVFTKQMVGHFSPNWEPGYSYTYHVELSGSAANLEVITFTTVDGDNWTDKVDTNTITIEQ